MILVPPGIHNIHFICTHLFIRSLIKLATRVIALISMIGNLKLLKINAISGSYFVNPDKRLRSTKKNSVKWLQSFVRRDLTNKYIKSERMLQATAFTNISLRKCSSLGKGVTQSVQGFEF